MAPKRTYTFKCTNTIQTAVAEIMETWQLDRTSVIKLALFLLSVYLQKENVKRLNLYELVQSIEQQAPPHFPRYASFGND